MNIGDTYIIRVEVDNRIFTYTGKIISEDNDFITFKDKFGKTYSYNKNKILSLEECKEWDTSSAFAVSESTGFWKKSRC